MSRPAFLDKGVLLGFCFTVDTHHRPCLKYLTQDGVEPYVTGEIDSAFDRNKSRLSRRYHDNILNHVSRLTKSNFEGEVGPMELQKIRKKLLDQGNNAFHFLEYYYREVAPSVTSIYELKTQLRDLARDIEQLSLTRKQEFDELVHEWEREDEYPDVEEALSEIKGEDMWVCIDAHDLAVNKEDETELATTDPKDMVKNGREDLILENTSISQIIDLAVKPADRWTQ